MINSKKVFFIIIIQKKKQRFIQIFFISIKNYPALVKTQKKLQHLVLSLRNEVEASK